MNRRLEFLRREVGVRKEPNVVPVRQNALLPKPAFQAPQQQQQQQQFQVPDPKSDSLNEAGARRQRENLNESKKLEATPKQHSADAAVNAASAPKSFAVPPPPLADDTRKRTYRVLGG